MGDLVKIINRMANSTDPDETAISSVLDDRYLTINVGLILVSATLIKKSNCWKLELGVA